MKYDILILIFKLNYFNCTQDLPYFLKIAHALIKRYKTL